MADYFDLSGKVALVTGGSRGLGRAMVKALAECGADVIVTSRDAASCAEAVAEVEALGRRGWAIPAHVGRWEAIDELVEAAYAAAGRIDILINNAGNAPAVAKSTDMTETLFDKTVGLNFKGPFRLASLVGERMVAQGSGSIINVSSTGAVHPEPEFAVYAAAKGALNIITKGHALEYGPNVRVNCIMAGPFWTDISKSWREEADKTINSAARRIGRPEEVVTAALYFASDHSSYTTGTVLTVDGGQR
ncbi:SDR family NAD(P)-dependent oxidoreductase [Rhizorhabdus dicambivorans]|uniref:3-oxoacyl-ACP reductase n=1 Tax=Rhizorhabdus dicambivorans TaxID=1850238 RepID=A0A2A4FVN2_9SPHN|nr:glucose 1-dehydrogenase [Rhizorhabdus dicambivorans]ATE66233.1 3-oxoacyl-ACP reductase [Rhizorhabdus dicambivorans]PCE41746.1 3-oxoacyl-ACP reductase [Rhizorhabdus dicambivorans]